MRSHAKPQRQTNKKKFLFNVHLPFFLPPLMSTLPF